MFFREVRHVDFSMISLNFQSLATNAQLKGHFYGLDLTCELSIFILVLGREQNTKRPDTVRIQSIDYIPIYLQIYPSVSDMILCQLEFSNSQNIPFIKEKRLSEIYIDLI